MNTTQSNDFAEAVVYPAAYDAAFEAKENGASDDEAYKAAQKAADRCVKENGNSGALSAAGAAYEATVACVANFGSEVAR